MALEFELLASYSISAGAVVANSVLRMRGAEDSHSKVRRAQHLSGIVTYIALNLLVFLSLVLMLAGIEGLQKTAREEAGLLGLLFELFNDAQSLIPLLAIVVLLAITNIPIIDRLDFSFRTWLQQTSYYDADTHELANTLVSIDFDPSQDELDKNARLVRKYGLDLANTNAPVLGSRFVDNWRKTCSLSRFIDEWEKNRAILLPRERGELQDLEETHERKTALAVTLILVGRRSVTDAAFRDHVESLVARLSGALPGERKQIEDQLIATMPMPGSEEALEEAESGKFIDIKKRLGEIEHYFDAEYERLVERLVLLASTAAVYASDETSGRVDDLRSAGFRDLPEFYRFSIERTLFTLFVIAAVIVGIFLSVFVFGTQLGIEIPLNRILVVIFMYTCATFAAVIVGSDRSIHGRQSKITMHSIVAGLFTMVATIVVNAVFTSIAMRGILAAQVYLGREDILAWTVLGFVLTWGICFLAGRRPMFSWMSQGRVRLKDGMALGTLLTVGSLFALATHNVLDTEFAGKVLIHNDRPHLLGYLLVLTNSFILGAAIGALTVKDVRSAMEASFRVHRES